MKGSGCSTTSVPGVPQQTRDHTSFREECEEEGEEKQVYCCPHEAAFSEERRCCVIKNPSQKN